MKCLISGLALAVALAVAGPVWAQTQMTPPAQSGAVTGSRHHRTVHHRVVHPRNSVADRLNAEELATLQNRSPVHRMPSGGLQLTSPGR